MSLESFDLLGYVEERCTIVRRYGVGEVLLSECPHCGAKNHCSVNVRKRAWRCYRCTWAGNNVEQFIAEVESVDLASARELIFAELLDQRRPEQIEELLEQHVEPEEVKSAPAVGVGLPEEYIPCYDKRTGKLKVPNYLCERGVSGETCMVFKLGWCERGRYRGRIIIPISTGDVVTFQARATWEDAKPKYLGRVGAPLSKVLMGYDMLRRGDELWVVEGPFDKLACHQAGIPAVPLTGKTLSDAQLKLIMMLEPAALHVMLDEDARSRVFTLAADLAFYVTTPVDMVLLKGGDPGELRERLVDQAYSFEEVVSPAQAKTLGR